MPGLPQYTARARASGSVRGAIPGAVDVSGLTRAAGAIANDAQQVMAAQDQEDLRIAREAQAERERQARQLADNEARVATINAESGLKLKAAEYLRQRQETPDGMIGATADVLKEYDGWVKEASEAAPEAARPLLATAAARMRSELNLNTFNAETGARQVKVVRDYGAGLDVDRRRVFEDPNQFDEAWAARLALVKNLAIPDDAREKLAVQSSDALVMSTVPTLIERDPAGVLAALTGGKNPNPHKALRMIPPSELDKVADEARRAIDRGQAAARGDLQSRTRDFQAFASGVSLGWSGDPAAIAPSQADYVAAFGPERGAKAWRDEVGVYIDQSRATQKLATASAEERSAIIKGAEPTGVDGAAAKLETQRNIIQANQIVERALKDDPAGYVSLSSPRVKAARAAYQQAAQADSPNTAQLFDRYATESLAEQQRMGAPAPKLLLAGEVSAIASSFVEKPPEQAAALVAGLEQTYGKQFPKVFQQLAQDGKLPGSVLVLPNMRDLGARAKLAALGGMKREDLDAMIPKGDAGTIRAELQAQFEPGARSFLAQSPSSARMVSTILEQAERLAYFYRSRGDDPKKAARDAIDQVFGWRYEFMGDARVPKEQQPALVQTGAAKLLRDATQVRLFITAYPMRAGDAAKQTVDAVQTNGTWVTNEDETGLVLKVRGQDGGLYTVENERGRRVEYSWQMLQQAARDQESSETGAAQAAREAAAERLRRAAGGR